MLQGPNDSDEMHRCIYRGPDAQTQPRDAGSLRFRQFSRRSRHVKRAYPDAKRCPSGPKSLQRLTSRQLSEINQFSKGAEPGRSLGALRDSTSCRPTIRAGPHMNQFGPPAVRSIKNEGARCRSTGTWHLVAGCPTITSSARESPRSDAPLPRDAAASRGHRPAESLGESRPGE